MNTPSLYLIFLEETLVKRALQACAHRYSHLIQAILLGFG